MKTCTNIRTIDSRVYVDFSDGTQREFNNFAEMVDLVKSADAPRMDCDLWLMAWWIKRDPNGSNPNLVIGKTLTFDLSAANLLRVQ